MTVDDLKTLLAEPVIVKVTGFAFGKQREGKLIRRPDLIRLTLGDTQVFSAHEASIEDKTAFGLLLDTMTTFEVQLA